MNIKRFSLKTCCGGTYIVYKIDQPIDKEFVNKFKQLGQNFIENSAFSKNGLIYLYNNVYIITGSFGANKLQVRCKKKNCEDNLGEFEELLSKME